MQVMYSEDTTSMLCYYLLTRVEHVDDIPTAHYISGIPRNSPWHHLTNWLNMVLFAVTYWFSLLTVQIYGLRSRNKVLYKIIVSVINMNCRRKCFQIVEFILRAPLVVWRAYVTWHMLVESGSGTYALHTTIRASRLDWLVVESVLKIGWGVRCTGFILFARRYCRHWLQMWAGWVC